MKKKIVMVLLVLSMLAANMLAACGTEESISCYATVDEEQVAYADLLVEKEVRVDDEIDHDAINEQLVQSVGEYDWGVILSAKDITSTGMTLVCTQDGGSPTGELSIGSWYKIEKQTDNGWEEVPFAYDAEGIEVCWTQEAWIIKHDGTTEWEVDWSWYYGNLTEPGVYRISKEIMDFRKTADYDKQVQYAEWAIID